MLVVRYPFLSSIHVVDVRLSCFDIEDLFA